MELYGRRVRVKKGWHDAGKCGTVLGDSIYVKQFWSPVLWDEDEDPTFCKETCLEFIDNDSIF